MIIGGLIGIGNEATPLIEKIIASSVLIHGILIAINRKIPIQVLYLLIAIFGFVHGYAHGAEMPDDNTALQYISGYVIGTILLSILGVLISKSINISSSPSSYSKTFLGGIVIGCGIILLLP